MTDYLCIICKLRTTGCFTTVTEKGETFEKWNICRHCGMKTSCKTRDKPHGDVATYSEICIECN